MVREKVCEKDGRGKKAMIKGRKVHKKGKNNGTRERMQSLGRE